MSIPRDNKADFQSTFLSLFSLLQHMCGILSEAGGGTKAEWLSLLRLVGRVMNGILQKSADFCMPQFMGELLRATNKMTHLDWNNHIWLCDLITGLFYGSVSLLVNCFIFQWCECSTAHYTSLLGPHWYNNLAREGDIQQNMEIWVIWNIQHENGEKKERKKRRKHHGGISSWMTCTTDKLKRKTSQTV